MLDKFKSITKDVAWFTIGATASVVYITYKAGKSIVDDIPEMMDFAQDTYSQVKDVLSKSTKSAMPKAEDYKSYQEFEDAVRDAGYTVFSDE